MVIEKSCSASITRHLLGGVTKWNYQRSTYLVQCQLEFESDANGVHRDWDFQPFNSSLSCMQESSNGHVTCYLTSVGLSSLTTYWPCRGQYCKTFWPHLSNAQCLSFVLLTFEVFGKFFIAGNQFAPFGRIKASDTFESFGWISGNIV